MNVVCKFCKKEMNVGQSCIEEPIQLNGRKFKQIKYGDEKNYLGGKKLPCNDCRVSKGQYHHVGCNNEECPICGNQLISCDCFH